MPACFKCHEEGKNVTISILTEYFMFPPHVFLTHNKGSPLFHICGPSSGNFSIGAQGFWVMAWCQIPVSGSNILTLFLFFLSFFLSSSPSPPLSTTTLGDVIWKYYLEKWELLAKMGARVDTFCLLPQPKGQQPIKKKKWSELPENQTIWKSNNQGVKEETFIQTSVQRQRNMAKWKNRSKLLKKN